MGKPFDFSKYVSSPVPASPSASVVHFHLTATHRTSATLLPLAQQEADKQVSWLTNDMQKGEKRPKKLISPRTIPNLSKQTPLTEAPSARLFPCS